MIVLDEQLLGRGIEHEITRWYSGSVKFIIDLRPGSVIKDDAIPGLLRQQDRPTFVTINVWDFWRKIVADQRYCVVCFGYPDSRIPEIPDRLRILFRHPELRPRSKRMGKIVRVYEDTINYYTEGRRKIEQILL